MITLMTQAIGVGIIMTCIFLFIGVFIFGTMWLTLDAVIGDFDSWKAIGRFFVKIAHGLEIAVDWIYEKIVYLLGIKRRQKESRQYKINILTRKFTEFKKGKIKC